MAYQNLIIIPLLIALFLSTSFVLVLGYSLDDANLWCAQTPYPNPCHYFLTQNQHSTPIKGKSGFLKISTSLAADRASHALTTAYSLAPKCHTAREKAAWADCLELYQLTIMSLNKTLDSQLCTQDDVQTWLSTALTSLETCRAGFSDLGVDQAHSVLPTTITSNNVSKLISNVLAINKAAAGQSFGPPEYKQGFPTCVKPSDRKLLQSSTLASQANVVVAQDGSGSYKTISQAVAAAAKRSGSGRYVIYVKQGVYKENVQIGTGLKNIMLAGDGMGKTIITGSRSVGGGSTTFNSATLAAVGNGFIAQDLTVRNTAGASNHQAVAVRSGSDLSAFYWCSLEGYQDTVYAHSNRQFYRECNIYGTVDFIFGNAASVFQKCNIYARYPPNKTNTLTAQGRTDPNQNTGIVIHNCYVGAASDLKPIQMSVRTYLGRPWKQYSRTVFMKTYIDNLVTAAGWKPRSGNFALDTLYYGEYMNTGPGSSTSERVTWKGYHVLTSAADVSKFTVGSFISGSSWLPATSVPFTAGL